MKKPGKIVQLTKNKTIKRYGKPETRIKRHHHKLYQQLSAEISRMKMDLVFQNISNKCLLEDIAKHVGMKLPPKKNHAAEVKANKPKITCGKCGQEIKK